MIQHSLFSPLMVKTAVFLGCLFAALFIKIYFRFVVEHSLNNLFIYNMINFLIVVGTRVIFLISIYTE